MVVRDISIRAFTWEELERNPDDLMHFKDSNGMIPDDPGPWIRMGIDNPNARVEDLALLLAVYDDRAVGRLGFYAGRSRVGGVQARSHWLDGFALHDAYRRTGAGAMIMLKARSILESMVASGGPSPAAQALYRSCGMQQIGPLQRWVRFFNVATPVAKLLPSMPALRASLRPVGQPLLRGYYRLRRSFLTLRTPLQFHEARIFDDSLDRRLGEDSTNRFERDSPVLNWVLRHRPTTRGFRLCRGHELCGYLLLRVDQRPAGGPGALPAMRVGSLLDYYLPPGMEDERLHMLDWSMRQFGEMGVDVMECQVLEPSMSRLCRRFGMVRIGGNQVFFKPTRPQRQAMDRPWFLTHAEGDVVLNS